MASSSKRSDDKNANESQAVHLLAGGVAGTLSAVITCPLDVAKTRFQSSLLSGAFRTSVGVAGVGNVTTTTGFGGNRPSLLRFFQHLIKTEGAGALFKGLGPTLIGIAPSRAIYFFTYSQCKRIYSDAIAPNSQLGNSLVHLTSATTAGLVTTTVTNPVWLIKTRLQLDQEKGTGWQSTSKCVRRVWKKEGIRGFYRGLTASYYGISETAIHFVIYEALRERFIAPTHEWTEEDRSSVLVRVITVAQYMGAAAMSKTIATCIAYPHEVARTRMREDGNHRYIRFWQTLKLVAAEEGTRGLYRGLGTQLIKHIPNAAIVMGTYEFVVEICRHYGL